MKTKTILFSNDHRKMESLRASDFPPYAAWKRLAVRLSRVGVCGPYRELVVAVGDFQHYTFAVRIMHAVGHPAGVWAIFSHRSARGVMGIARQDKTV